MKKTIWKLLLKYYEFSLYLDNKKYNTLTNKLDLCSSYMSNYRKNDLRHKIREKFHIITRKEWFVKTIKNYCQL